MELKAGRLALTDTGEVVHMAAAGREEAWDELHRRFSRLIAGVARSAGCPSADLSDVQQAVWARLFQHIGRLHEPRSLGGWLAVVTRRECFRLAGKRRPVVEVDEVEPVAASDEEPLANVIHAERRAAVRRAVAGLTPRQRRLLETMLDHPDLDYDQLAARLSMPRGSIGPTRQRCLDELRRRRELRDWCSSALPA